MYELNLTAAEKIETIMDTYLRGRGSHKGKFGSVVQVMNGYNITLDNGSEYRVRQVLAGWEVRNLNKKLVGIDHDLWTAAHMAVNG